jgi:anti-anti-sigma factor
VNVNVDLEVSSSLTPPSAHLTVRGELDLVSADTIDASIDQTAARGCTLVTIGLDEVTFIDGAGIQALVEARHRLDAASSTLSVTGVSRQVARMMKLTGTAAFFGVSDPPLVGC